MQLLNKSGFFDFSWGFKSITRTDIETREKRSKEQNDARRVLTFGFAFNAI
jgi:hypothetical protein